MVANYDIFFLLDKWFSKLPLFEVTIGSVTVFNVVVVGDVVGVVGVWIVVGVVGFVVDVVGLCVVVVGVVGFCVVVVGVVGLCVVVVGVVGFCVVVVDVVGFCVVVVVDLVVFVEVVDWVEIDTWLPHWSLQRLSEQQWVQLCDTCSASSLVTALQTYNTINNTIIV